MPQDPYATLGVDRDADADALKKAYRKLARQYHPDVNSDPGAQEKFKEVSAAYEILSDPEKRRVYDLGGDPFGQAGGFGQGQGFSFTDIMDAFFGGQQGGASRGPRSRQRRGQDALVRLDLELAEAAFGATRELKVDTAVLCTTCLGSGAAEGSHPVTCETCHGRGEVQHVQRSFLGEIRTLRPCAACRGYGEIIPDPCRDCAGDGRLRSRRAITVKIPPGVDTGTRVQLSGEGEVGPGGGPAGDLYVEIQVSPHRTFTREGLNLHCRIAIPMTAGALGTSIELPLLEGDLETEEIEVERSVTIDVKPGTQSGTEHVLRGRGVPSLRSQARGDVVVTIEVETPSKLDDRQEALLRELAALRDEESPDGRVQPAHKGLFGRVRDAFKQ
ncbi:molecular chaperone DnaJ [Nocardioides marmoriginsengisoli]|uniref:Chaperone protein DnaJ n=1 Tax=Nocardioides marmoriginsengisoli TaxID=661483 RepID=A0A3N0CJS6_9ACTN|nr:molecular chaperone DnaJ [Nocardioides marmoriginsengisoli]RNL63718.1 molecular chaperone DnaJ [Nocardioides marmoriginsengisoli]